LGVGLRTTAASRPHVEALLKILELERSKGYGNVAVVGGLDRYLRNYLKKDRDTGGSSSAICPPDFSYAALTKEQRRQWAEKTRRLLTERPSDKPSSAKKSSARPVPVKQAPPPPPGMTLDSPITAVKGIGPNMASRFAKLGVRTIREMLYFFPRRHMDYGNQRRVSELDVGLEQTLVATVWEARQVNLGGRLGTEAIVGDETGNVRAVWFNQPYLAQRFRTNARLVLFGKVGVYKGKQVFESPEWELLESEALPHADMLVPVYPLTEGLYPRSVRRLAKAVVSGWAPRLGDHLPGEVRNRCALMPLSEAIQQAHFPDSSESRNEARRRLAFDELFLIQMGVAARKLEWQETQASAAFRIDDDLLRRFGHGLPFSFTPAQERALKEILTDVSQTRPMSRLLEGDVGSGKTVVATAALMMAAANGCQGALMAPTEILAEQHFNTIAGLLSRLGAHDVGAPQEVQDASCGESDGVPQFQPSPKSGGSRGLRKKPETVSDGDNRYLLEFPSVPPYPFVMALLTGSLKAGAKRKTQKQAAEGGVHLVIGTHALIQKSVKFQKLGLVVVDEQHRFGVLQRSALRQKGANPHVLVMTATPIPRTLALTLYGDLDLSVIDEMPPGRVAIETKWLEPAQRQAAYNFVRRKIGEGRQAFVVCPLIEESESIEAKAAVAEYKRLSEEIFPDLRLGLLHGRMSSADKESVMRSFKDRQLDILVSTPVVEVGIDVPNAVVMLIEGADRFGLSQLHQFRGRVGRGEHKSYCLLLAESPSFEGRERLKIIERTRDGFLLAEEDLRLRGPGEFFGTQQSGLPDLRMARLSDVALLEMARGEAIRLLESDRGLKRPEHRLLAKEVARVWRAGGEAG
jgi:ATP-dependent DNA helicase RecG